MLSAFDPARITGSDAAPVASGAAAAPFGIVAGGGALPHLVAESIRGQGREPLIIAVGDGMREDWSAYRHRLMQWSQTGDIFPYLRRAGVHELVFCGTISVRPDYKSLIPSWRTLLLLPEIFRIVRGGDDTMLRAVSRAFEARGFSLRAVQDIVPELLAPEGLIAGRAPDDAEKEALAHAHRVAMQIGELDIGQAVVASAPRVIALEAIEGTREMLERVADLRRRRRVGPSERMVLVKSVKPQQDHRFDLPSIGVETIYQAHEAGIRGIGVSAGASLLIGIDEIAAAAAEHDMFLVGLPAMETPRVAP